MNKLEKNLECSESYGIEFKLTHQNWHLCNHKHFPYYFSYEETHHNSHIHQIQIDLESVMKQNNV